MQLNDALRNFKKFISTVTFSDDSAQWEVGVSEYMITREDLTVTVSGADARSYRRCLEDLYSAVASKKTISRHAVEDSANTTFVHIARVRILPHNDAELQSACDEQIKQLRTSLDAKPHKWEVIQRICGIDQHGLPLKIGKITITLATESVLDGIQETEITKGQTKEYFSGHTLALIPVFAVDKDAALAAATKSLQEAIDCLNFFGDGKQAGSQAYILGKRKVVRRWPLPTAPTRLI